MNEYNERTLKNVLEDIREEQDIELLKEIEEAANNPLYQNKAGEAEKFAKKNTKSAKRKFITTFSKVAVILLVLSIGSAIIPITVEGRKNTIAEIIINFVNTEFFAIDNENLLLDFEGEYVPTWIPDGYCVESIDNAKGKKEIVFKNSDGNIITFKELPPGYKMNIDSTNTENASNIKINDQNAVYIEEDEIRKIIITATDAFLYIASDDSEVDLIGFSKRIEKN